MYSTTKYSVFNTPPHFLGQNPGITTEKLGYGKNPDNMYLVKVYTNAIMRSYFVETKLLITTNQQKR